MSNVSDYSTVGHVIKSHSQPLIFYIFKYIYGHFILPDGCYFLSFSLCSPLFLAIKVWFSVIPVQFFVACLLFFCYIQNSFCHAFNLLCRGYTCNLFCYSNYSLCDIHYFKCCTLSFLSVVHNSANTHCYFGVAVPPTQFAVS